MWRNDRRGWRARASSEGVSGRNQEGKSGLVNEPLEFLSLLPTHAANQTQLTTFFTRIVAILSSFAYQIGQDPVVGLPHVFPHVERDPRANACGLEPPEGTPTVALGCRMFQTFANPTEN